MTESKNRLGEVGCGRFVPLIVFQRVCHHEIYLVGNLILYCVRKYSGCQCSGSFSRCACKECMGFTVFPISLRRVCPVSSSLGYYRAFQIGDTGSSSIIGCTCHLAVCIKSPYLYGLPVGKLVSGKRHSSGRRLAYVSFKSDSPAIRKLYKLAIGATCQNCGRYGSHHHNLFHILYLLIIKSPLCYSGMKWLFPFYLRE